MNPSKLIKLRTVRAGINKIYPYSIINFTDHFLKMKTLVPIQVI